MCLSESLATVFVEDRMTKRENKREVRKMIMDGWDEDEGGSSRRDLQHFIGELAR